MFQRVFVLAITLILSSSVFASTDFCARALNDPRSDKLLRSLATKLQYTYEEFCQSERILDVFQEDKLVYHRETDSYQPYVFVTLHYNEYSCEYQFNLQQDRWMNQQCYNTF